MGHMADRCESHRRLPSQLLVCGPHQPRQVSGRENCVTEGHIPRLPGLVRLLLLVLCDPPCFAVKEEIESWPKKIYPEGPGTENHDSIDDERNNRCELQDRNRLQSTARTNATKCS